MAEYPKQFIENLNAQCSKEGWPLVGLYVLAIFVTSTAIYIVGEIANSLW
jgi:hypothetical protein